MIKIENLHFSYSKDSVLKDLNIEWKLNEIHGLMGSNGSGKSTLFKILKGLLKPNKGLITFKEQELRSPQIAFLPTETFFYPRVSGKEYLELFKIRNPGFDYEYWNDLFNLPLNKIVDSYSTGMKKKLAFLSCMALDKEILILDEPYNGLDAESYHIFQEILKSQKEKGKTIIISSHISDTLKKICSDISFLDNGRIQKIFLENEYAEMDEKIFSGTLNKTRTKLKGL